LTADDRNCHGTAGVPAGVDAVDNAAIVVVEVLGNSDNFRTDEKGFVNVDFVSAVAAVNAVAALAVVVAATEDVANANAMGRHIAGAHFLHMASEGEWNCELCAACAMDMRSVVRVDLNNFQEDVADKVHFSDLLYEGWTC